MSLACKYQATSIDGDLLELQEFVPRIDKGRFQGEAKYRLAQLISLVARYEPYYIEKLGIYRHFSEPGMSQAIQHILDSAEFADVVSAYGRLGYLRKPRTALRRLKSAIRTLVKNREFRLVVRGVKDVSSLASKGLPAEILEDLVKTAESDDSFSPSFGTLSPFYQSIYEATLYEKDPLCRPPPGMALSIQPYKFGVCGHIWLYEGENFTFDPRQEFNYAKRTSALARNPQLVSRFGVKVDHHYHSH